MIPLILLQLLKPRRILIKPTTPLRDSILIKQLLSSSGTADPESRMRFPCALDRVDWRKRWNRLRPRRERLAMTEKELAKARKSGSRISNGSDSSSVKSARLTAYSAKWCARLTPYSRRWRRIRAAIACAELWGRSHVFVLCGLYTGLDGLSCLRGV